MASRILETRHVADGIVGEARRAGLWGAQALRHLSDVAGGGVIEVLRHAPDGIGHRLETPVTRDDFNGRAE